MPIVKYKNQSGVTYAYEQTSQYDPVKKQSRPIRKYLGRVDPETGEIISTKGKRGRPPKKEGAGKSPAEAAADFRKLYEDAAKELEQMRKRLQEKEDECRELEEQSGKLLAILLSIRERIDASLHP